MTNFLDLQQDSLSGDLFVSPLVNDFVIAPSDNQHQADIISSSAGEWKQYPSMGVGANNYLNSAGQTAQLSQSIILQLQADGYTASKPTINFDASGNLQIVPNAFRN
jgi:hypothetical protein